MEALINSPGSLPAAVTDDDDDDELRCSKPKSCSSSVEEADVDCGMEFSKTDEDGELKPADDVVIMFPTVGNALGCSGFVCVNAGRPM